MKYKVRFNKTRGMPNRGSLDHVWRVFEGGKEYLCKNIVMKNSSWGEIDENGVDWNICCEGSLSIDKETSTITIS